MLQHVSYCRWGDQTTLRHYSANCIGWVSERIQLWLGMLAYRCLHSTASLYLAESLKLVRDVDAQTSRTSLLSWFHDATTVTCSTCCSTLGDRAFPVSAARTWNALPSAIKAASSLASFRQKLKNTLLQESFPDALPTACYTVPL